MEALKHWNSKRGGKYTIPRKGTEEYEEVRALMGSSETVSMPKKEYMAEHKRLTKVLKEADTPSARKEMALQKKEVLHMADPPKEKWVQEAVSHMKKGALTKTASREHMKPLPFAKKVVAHPEEYSETTRKRAQFLVNIQGKD